MDKMIKSQLEVTRTYTFPEYNIVIDAKNIEEATEKLQKILKSSNTQ